MSVELNSQPTTHRRKKNCDCKLARHDHGTARGYAVCGCGCLPCRLAYLAQHQDLLAGRRIGVGRVSPCVPSAGTRRRIEALHAIGWTALELATRMNIAHQHIHRLRTLDRPVMPATAERIAALYDELWDQAPPSTTRGERHAASYIKNLAKRRGWVPPLAWDDDTIDNPDYIPTVMHTDSHGFLDEVLVDRIMAGTLRLPRWQRSPERVEAIHRLVELGFKDRLIGERVGLSRDAVAATRIRHQREDAAA